MSLLGVTPMRAFRKTANPSHYNQRFKPSSGLDGVYVNYWSNIHGADGHEPNRTQRDPSKFNYSNNIFKNDLWEWRMRGADYFYQIYSRLHRSNDAWTRGLVAYSSFCFLMFNQALIWKMHLAFTGAALASRIRDKGAAPTIDEVWVLDQIFQHEKLSSMFSPNSYHVMDYGRSNPLFPEYRTPTAKFFNADCNTSTGMYKFGDVESGAMMTLHFKTMPYSHNKYNFTEPFLVYDMWAEVSHEGNYEVIPMIKAEETFQTKRIFVLWH
jgi:hypothetical protein